MSFDRHSIPLLAEALEHLEHGFSNLPDATPQTEPDAMREALLAAAERLREDLPYHHPLYVGQMLKPPHPVARLAYALAMWINPNNHALDGGRASSSMEKDAVAQIATMFGLEPHLGHLCGGGTMANFEALWVARQLSSGKAVAASAQAHYTHSRLSEVLGVSFRTIDVDARGRMNPRALEQALREGDIGVVVATLGTTSAGALDPLPEILELRQRYGFRLHVDAAYGGYFTLASALDSADQQTLAQIGQADSVVIDPHKHGLQPYGCGCILFRDPAVGQLYQHDSPYTYFSSPELHLGEISLECSRPGASAVALWTTLQMLPLQRGERFSQQLDACREAAQILYHSLEQDPRFAPLFSPQLDIVVWAVRSRQAKEASEKAQQIFDAAAEQDLHLALCTFPREMAAPANPVQEWDADEIVCLRACAMKPEHREWMPEILRRLDAASSV